MALLMFEDMSKAPMKELTESSSR